MAAKPSPLAVVPKALTLWRISTHVALDGRGAFRYGGRWNTPGNYVVYLAESPAGAMLETLVHLSPDKISIPDYYRLMRLEVSGSPACSPLDLPEPENWQTDFARTRLLGDAWLKASDTPLARVPSAAVPHTWNYLLNPIHASAIDIRVVETSKHLYDPRLLRVRTS